MLKRELKDQFPPMNVVWLARESLKRLKQTGSIWDYVKDFISEEEKLFNFISGLQGWAQTKIRGQGVHDLPADMATVECLVDYNLGGTIDTI